MSESTPNKANFPEFPGNSIPSIQNNSSVTSSEANNRLLEILSGQLLTVARELGKVFFIIIFFCVFLLSSVAWTTWRLNKVEDALIESVKINEQAKKQIWELKTALNLKFSDERSRGKSKTEMP